MKFSSPISASLVALACVMASCSHKSNTYNINGSIQAPDSTKVFLISLANGDTVGNTVILDNAFSFNDQIEEPVVAQIRVGARNAGQFILEPGTINFTAEAITGTPLNDVLNGYFEKQMEMMTEYRTIMSDTVAPDEQAANNLYESFVAYSDSLMQANVTNAVGVALLLDLAYDMSLDELQAAVEKNPSLTNYKTVRTILDNKKLAVETSEGKPYKDFTVEYEGKSTSLSDLINEGRYTLVDFWASWCGPCRREIPVIKDILAEYGPKGLDVVGVAVWDEPEASVNAMEELQITWPVIINAQRIPTDMYGILGIPTIILIGPDGTILSRGKQGEELKAAVAEAMSTK